jgi:hypothetical protein
MTKWGGNLLYKLGKPSTHQTFVQAWQDDRGCFRKMFTMKRDLTPLWTSRHQNSLEEEFENQS